MSDFSEGVLRITRRHYYSDTIQFNSIQFNSISLIQEGNVWCLHGIDNKLSKIDKTENINRTDT